MLYINYVSTLLAIE